MNPTWSLIEELVPFCVILTQDRTITGLGVSLRQRFPQLKEGDSFDTHFEVIRPRRPNTSATPESFPSGHFLIMKLRGTGLRLRGSAKRLEDGYTLLQLAPAIRSEQELSDSGLQFRDLPLYDNSLDLVISLRAYSDALAQTRKLATELEVQNHAISLAHEELVYALDKERAATRFKNRVLNMLSHEFRTSLAQILSVAELMRRGIRVDTPEHLHLHGNTLAAAVAQITEAFENLSAYAKADDARVAHRKERVNLTAIIGEVVHLIPGMDTSGIKIHYVPNPASEVFQSSRGVVLIILSNLVSNAVKYSKPGGEVQISTKRVGSQIQIRVADQGIGIPEALRPHVFESHTRGGNVGATPGSGLGLSIVALCVDSLSGAIDFHSVVGEGTEFTVSLPVDFGD